MTKTYWAKREAEWDETWLYTQALRAAIPPDSENDDERARYKRFEKVADEGLNIDDAMLAELAARIAPVVRRKGVLYHIKPVDPRDVAFTWDPKITKPADPKPTLHGYGYQGFFKPSIAEVLSQLPRDMAGVVVAFETDGPNNVDDLNGEKIALHAGYHVATTTFYRLG